MLVHEVMSSPAVTVSPGTSLKGAIQLLDAHAITSLPVVDHDGRLVGVVSEADVLRDTVQADPRIHDHAVDLSGAIAVLSVADVMTHLPISVAPDDDVADAVEFLVDTQVKSLPVVSFGRVVGVISRRDVIAVLARRDERIEAEVDEALHEAGVDCSVEVHDGVVRLADAESEESLRVARVIAARVKGVVGVTAVGVA